MKKIVGIMFLLFVSMYFSFSCFAFVVGDVNSDNKIDLTEAINALQVSSGLRTAAAMGTTINVPGQVATIQGAIDAAASGDIINVAAGNYTESLTVKNKTVTIQGAGSGSTAITGTPGIDTFTIDTANVVVISGLTVQGGNIGIYAKRGSVVEVKNAVVQDTTAQGIYISENSTARLTNVTVQRSSGNHGIQASRSSSITFYGTIVSNNNGQDGIIIFDSSSGYFSSATVTTNNNGRYGVNSSTNSGIYVDSSSITSQSNVNHNIRIWGSSAISAQNSSSVLSDTTDQTGVNASSAAVLYTDTTSSLTVRNGKTYGLSIGLTSNAYLNGPVLVEKSGSSSAPGVVISNTSNLYINGVMDIKDNGHIGLYMMHSSVQVNTAGKLTISGTTGGNGDGIFLEGNAYLRVYQGGLTVQNNSAGSLGRGIALYRGSQVGLFPLLPNTVSIKNNLVGIVANDGSVSGGNVANTIDVSGNTNIDIVLQFGSKASGFRAGSFGTCQQDSSSMGLACQ